jgi:chloride channel protein, CIC family
LSKESIYTLKLVRRGYPVPDTMHADLLHAKRARDFMDTHIKIIGLSEAGRMSRYWANPGISYLIVQEDDKLIGALPRESAEDDLAHQGGESDFKGRIMKDYVIVKETDTLFSVIEKLHNNNKAPLALIVSDKEKTGFHKVVGVITRELITKALEEYEELFSD